MGKGFQFLLGSGVLLALLIAFGTWFMGPSLAYLAYLDTQRNEAMVVLDFAGADAVYDEASVAYHSTLLEMSKLEGGEALGRYRLVHMLEGSRTSEFGGLLALRMNRGADIVKVMTDSEYRQLHGAQARAPVKLASFSRAPAQWPEAIVVWMLEQRETEERDPLSLILAHMSSSGEILWDAQVRALNGDVRAEDTASLSSNKDAASLNRVVVVGYQSAQDALAVLRLPELADLRSIASSRSKRLVLSVYSR